MTWLGRWRIDGTNWEGRKWFLTPGGVALARELNELWPEGTATDGTVASQGHDANNPRSDHRPKPHNASPAVVRALDAGEKVENDGQELFDLLLTSRDPRIKYVLHENKIFSSYSRSGRAAWEVKEGSYGHPGHVHVSLTALADTDDSPWNLKGNEMGFTAHEEDELKRLIAALDEVNSNGSFAKYAVQHLRNHPSGGGVTQSQVVQAIQNHAGDPDAHHE